MTVETNPEASTNDAPTISELRPGQRFEGRFAVLRKDRQTSKNGGSYLALELRDRTGRLPARAFRDADRIGLRFEAGDAIQAKGKLERFRGELVAEIDDARKLEEGSFDPGEFLPAAYRSVEELEGFLEHLTTEVHNDALRGVVERVLFAGPDAAGFRRSPATRSAHHAYLGGLLEHSVAVGTLVGEICQLHPRLDSDMLMAAALLHDVGRSREFTYGAEFGISEEGRMLGHLEIGAQIVGGATADLDPAQRLKLLNCVLAHHGPDAGPGRAAQGPSGAPGRGFASPEALALYRLNSLEAGVKGALEHG
jgi:3'-5' exoribonuclease